MAAAAARARMPGMGSSMLRSAATSSRAAASVSAASAWKPSVPCGALLRGQNEGEG